MSLRLILCPSMRNLGMFIAPGPVSMEPFGQTTEGTNQVRNRAVTKKDDQSTYRTKANGQKVFVPATMSHSADIPDDGKQSRHS